MEKKTAKYYREIFNGNDVRKAVAVLPEVIKKYGYKRWDDYSKCNDVLNIRKYTEFEWNHRINEFFLNSKGVACIDIYWQGDSTDGNDSLYASECIYGKTIPAEHEFINGRTYYRHGDLRISAEEFRDALKAVAKYLAPEEIKARKIATERGNKSTAIFNMIDSKKKDMDRWEMEGFWNGRIAVQKVFENNSELIDLPIEKLFAIANEVFDKNNRSDYSLRGGYYNGEKKYNLSYTA